MTFGVGIQFKKITKEDIALLSEFIKKNVSVLRRFQREPTDFLVKYLPKNKKDWITSQALDLCPGGIFLKEKPPLKKETIISLQFILPGIDQMIRCKGRVTWISENIPEIFFGQLKAGMGIEFMDLLDSDLKLIDQVMDKASIQE